MITEVQPTATEQFIDDFLMVVENDFEAWSRITQMAESTHLFQFAQDLSDNYDLLVDTALQQVTDKFAKDLFRQLLNGWGSDVWYKVASIIQERVEEDGN